MQESINERIKFLIDSLKMSVRAFSAALDVPASTTRNYLDKGTKPSTDYIERIAEHFKTVNIHWLITGEGEPLLPSSSENLPNRADGQKFFRNQIIGSNQGTAKQEQNTTAASDEALKTKLTLAEQEIQHLRTQLEMQAALLAAKDETISLLRGSYRNPN